MKSGKVWGETEPLLITPNLEVHKFMAVKDGFCSKHKHVHKWNAFLVISGTLKIEV